MTIEEKAKAYDEALEKVRPMYQRAKENDNPSYAVYEDLFPELKESEDERIRKELIQFLRDYPTNLPNGKYSRSDFFAWLEKQKVSTDGDFARGYDCGYECCLNSHGAEWFEKQKEQKDYHKLYEDIAQSEWFNKAYKGKSLRNDDEQKSSIVEKLREISTPADEDWFEIEKKWESEDNEDLRPFISVKFASNAKVIDGKRFAVFTWERFKDVALELINRGKEEQKEQKPAEWNEEDKNKFDLLHTCIRHCINDPHWEYSKREKVSKEIIPFIEKLKSIRSQSKVEWSEEDEKMLERCISKMANIIPAPGKHVLEDMSFEKHTDEELAIWLESLPERFNLQPKQKWNKEDKIRLDSIISSYRELLQDYKTCHGVDYIPDTSDTFIRNVVDDVDFLKSLRPSWKPSEEQITALKVVARGFQANDPDAIDSLLVDLQNYFSL